MVTRVYSSTDLGAPSLTGQVDSLNNLLKAVLIDGIGAAPTTPWELSFEDVLGHMCVFRPPQGPRHYLQVNENAPGAGAQKECRMRGFVEMTTYALGTEPFPTVAQLANGLCVRKSATADPVARTWRAQVDEKTLYLWINCGDLTNTWDFYAFGAYLDWKPAGAYGSWITGRYVENAATHTSTQNGAALMYATTVTPAKMYIPRDHTQTGTAVEVGIQYDSASAASVAAVMPGSVGLPYPYDVDAGIIMMPYRIASGPLTIGRARGLWIPGHNKPLLQDDIFSATEGALTRNFVAQNLLGTGQIFVETSNTWDTD